MSLEEKTMLFLLSLLPLASLAVYSIPQLAENPTEYARQHHLKHLARVAGYDIFDRLPGRDAARMPLPPGLVKQEKRVQHKRSGSDPLYPSQFHLHDNPYSVDAPASGKGGRGVYVAIVDDGVQHTHPDLQQNYNAEHSYDYNGHDNDPMPSSYDGHGTSCAGVCCAVANNNHCGRGVAPEASIVGIRLIGGAVYDYEEAMGLTHHSDSIRIYSSSWGPQDDGLEMVEPGPVVKEALKRGYESGRQIYVWAGGNGRQENDSSNYDGYANSPYTLAIGAIDHNGNQAYYSESGANLLAVTPSSGGGKGISTTDLMGRQGYSSGECTNSFGGTSSAAPLAAGIFARMLEVRPDLQVRDIQHIVAKHAFKNLPGGAGSWSTPNARGYTHSNEFGFGLLKVPALLEAARGHKLIGGNLRRVRQSGSSLVLMAPGNLTFIEQVLIAVQMTPYEPWGKVSVSLTSPQTRSILAGIRGDSHRGQSTWTYSSLRHWGEELVAGNQWEVKVWDSQGRTGFVQRVELEWMGF